MEKKGLLSDELFWELSTYHADVESQINFNRKEEYFLLVDQYLRQQIDSYEFRRLFLIMHNEDSEATYIICSNLQTLETFKLVNHLSKISDLITEISILCLDFSQTYEETETEIAESEIKFYSLVKKHYLKLQKFLSYEKLIFRSFNTLKWIIGSEISIILLYIIVRK